MVKKMRQNLYVRKWLCINDSFSNNMINKYKIINLGYQLATIMIELMLM